MTYYSKYLIQEDGNTCVIEAGFSKKITLRQAKNIANWCRTKDWNTMYIRDLESKATYTQKWPGVKWIKISSRA